jgi:hypothetical protein
MPYFRTLAVFLVFASVAAADELRTLDNKTYSGTLIAVDAKEVTFKTSEGPVKVPLDIVIAIDVRPQPKYPPEANYTEITLVDDSVLVCKKEVLVDGKMVDATRIAGKDVDTTLVNGQKLKLPLATVATVLKQAQDNKLREKWNVVLAEKIKRDRLVRYAEGSVNVLDGTILGADDKGTVIQFKDAGGSEYKFPVERITGMTFFREANVAFAPICMVYDLDGNAFAAKAVITKGDKLEIVSPATGEVFVVDQVRVARFDYNMGKLTFLSDMAFKKAPVCKSAIGLIVAPHKDTNLDGDPIVLDKAYPKGLSLHAHTELEYDLKGKYKKFSCVVGVDTRVGADSQAKLTIKVDDREVFSKVVTGKDAAFPVEINVINGQTLKIIVSSSNNLDLHDHVTLAIPKITQ